jgi:hypothetical protein
VLWAGTLADPGGAAAYGDAGEYAGGGGSHPALAAIGVDEVLDAAGEVDRAGRVRGAVAA